VKIWVLAVCRSPKHTLRQEQLSGKWGSGKRTIRTKWGPPPMESSLKRRVRGVRELNEKPTSARAPKRPVVKNSNIMAGACGKKRREGKGARRAIQGRKISGTSEGPKKKTLVRRSPATLKGRKNGKAEMGGRIPPLTNHERNGFNGKFHGRPQPVGKAGGRQTGNEKKAVGSSGEKKGGKVIFKDRRRGRRRRNFFHLKSYSFGGNEAFTQQKENDERKQKRGKNQIRNQSANPIQKKQM